MMHSFREERQQRVSAVEAAMQCFSKTMEVKVETRAIYTSETLKRLSDDRRKSFASVGQMRGQFWDKHEDKRDVLRNRVDADKAAAQGIDPAKMPKRPARPAKTTRPDLLQNP